MNNKKLGNSFEQELSEVLSKYGFWVHCMAMNKSGQPADIIAVKNKKAHLIDAKVCSSRGFALSRVEENQDLAMTLWFERGNGQGWFAIKMNEEIYMLPHLMIQAFMKNKSTMSYSEISECGITIERWVKECK